MNKEIKSQMKMKKVFAKAVIKAIKLLLWVETQKIDIEGKNAICENIAGIFEENTDE